MPRTEEANQRIREDQRAKILEAALSVFARKGMEATIADVATAANVSYGLIYRYFVNKEALLVELIENVLRDSPKTLKQALEMPGTPVERLHLLLVQILNGIREHPEFVLLVQQMLGAKGEHNHPREHEQISQLADEQALPNKTVGYLCTLAQEQSQTYRSVLRQLVIEGQAVGEIANDDPDQLVGTIMACITGLSQRAMWQAPQEFQKTFPDVTIILRMVNLPRKGENKSA